MFLLAYNIIDAYGQRSDLSRYYYKKHEKWIYGTDLLELLRTLFLFLDVKNIYIHMYKETKTY